MHKFLAIKRIVDEHATVGEAIAKLVELKCIPSADPSHLDFIEIDLPRLKRCLARMQDIKTMARYIFQGNFTDEEKMFVFNQEISFSYAAKMLVSIGLQHRHFSNNPTTGEVVKAELAIAMRTPVSTFNEESRTPPSSPIVNVSVIHPAIMKRPSIIRSSTIRRSKKADPLRQPGNCRISDLLCNEAMVAVTAKQTRPPLPPPPTPCGRN
jgi:hypothetical protein